MSLPFAAAAQPAVLALDWDGATDAVLLGRHPACEVVLDDLTVSRRHAQLHFRDGRWVLQDLGSKNGTTVNGAPVTRCQLRPGDHLRLGEQHLVVD
jgi:pSer/pThr/pTyr-binding forkhead associated (FHA) protein